ncbi:MAG: ABC transporter substrate-binding protein [Pseudomonadota bacterium]
MFRQLFKARDTWRAPVSVLITGFLSLTTSATAVASIPYFSDDVASGKLPPMEQRIPAEPAIAEFSGSETTGQYGGQLRLLMGKSKDIRLMMVYGYARLIGYTPEHELVADILRDFTVEDGRIFTFHLRKGHRWSDGEPFTSEAFRYYWENIVNNEDLFPFGLPAKLMVEGEPPAVSFPDDLTVRYEWSKPNPYFVPALAAPRPMFIYAPGHYLEQFHSDFTPEEELQTKVEEAGVRNWAGLHHRKNHPYKNDNPELPSLQPWVNSTRPPAERFVFERNAYYHRVDDNGRQLPYIDEVVVNITSKSLVAAKTGAGESDLQGRYIRLDNYTFLKEGESRNDFNVRLWSSGTGSQFAIYPNLNSNDPVWRDLVRNREFRRALSVGINRHEINQVIYFGLAQASANTVLPSCSLFEPEYQTEWTQFDLDLANDILDRMGMREKDSRGIRLMSDGRPLEIILQTAGEGTEETDILELIGESWFKLGVKLHVKPSQREVFRERVFSGDAMMALFNGIDNGSPTADMSPREFAPTNQTQLQWPKWGQYFETNQKVGEAPDIPEAMQLLELYESWSRSRNSVEREMIWHEMLKIHSEEVFSIGLVCGVPQPVVVNNKLRNVPEEGVYSWEPNSFFGVYRPDTFWFE